MVEKDQMDKREFVGLFKQQFIEHGCLWRTHLDNRFADFFESFFIYGPDPLIRYCKFKIPKTGNPLKCPSNLLELGLDYHVNDLGLKI